MTAVLDKAQLPDGAQISIGNTKNPVGVLQSGLSEDGDVLAYQAMMASARRKGASLYRAGSNFNDEIMERVHSGYGRHYGMPGVRMSAQTIEALQQSELQRDQTFSGENSKWTGYYLEDAAKLIMPLRTPFKNILPRRPGPGINKMHWRTITDVFNGNGPTVEDFVLQQGGASKLLTYKFEDLEVVFQTLSTSDKITEKSELYSRSFDPAMRSKIIANLMPALMLGQEVWYLQSSEKLWSPPAPIVAGANSGGSLNSGNYWFLVTAVNDNGETLAVSSTAKSGSTTGTGTMTLTIFRVPGATKYNVYAATNTTQPANTAMYLQSAATNFGGATALNDPGGLTPGYFTAAMTTLATTGTVYSSVVTAGNTAIRSKSTDPDTLNQALTNDGYISLIYKYKGAGSTKFVGGNTSQIQTVGGNLTQDAIDDLLESGYYNAAADPDYMLVPVKDSRTVTNIVATATNYRVVSNNGPSQSELTAGFRATKYINPVTGKLIDILMMPYLPQGTIAFTSMSIPFPASEIPDPPLRVEYNKEMWAREFPPDQANQTQWQYSVYSDEAMVCQYLGGQLCLDGITLA